MDWSAGGVRLLTEPQDWPQNDHPRRAGVSSFGLSGTNAHVILEHAPEHPATASDHSETDPARMEPGLPVPCLVSGRTDAALRAQAGLLLETLSRQPDLVPAHLARALALSRSSFEHRAVVVATERDDLIHELRELAEGGTGTHTVAGTVGAEGKVAFLFSGQGAQRPGMGRELYEAFPVFADAFDDVCAHVGEDLKSVVFGDDAELLNRTEWTQPALFAVEVALFRLVESFGMRPDFLVGHSIGEFAAAHVAGVLSLADACRLVVARGQLMQALPSDGVMVAVEASEAEVLPQLEGRTDEVSIAAVNGPRAVVIAGAEAAVSEVADRLSASGCRTSRLRVSHAFHSPLMEPMLAEFRAVAEQVTYAAPTIPVVSNLTGTVAGDGELVTADYWARHVREAVRFADGIRALTDQGVTRFLEIGPDSTLTALTQHSLPQFTDSGAEAGHSCAALLRKQMPECAAVLRGIAQMHTTGVDVDWSSILRRAAAPGAEAIPNRLVELPTYPFQRTRFWPTIVPDHLQLTTGRDTGGGASAADRADTLLWQTLERTQSPELADALGVPEEALHTVLPALQSFRSAHTERVETEGWRYRVGWEAVPDGAGASVDGRWLLLQPPGEPLFDELEKFVPGLERLTCEAQDRDGLARLIAKAVEEGAPDGVLSCLSLPSASSADAGTAGTDPAETGAAGTESAEVGRGVATAMAVVQALGDAGVDARLWTVTQAGFGPGSAPHDPEQAGVWGLGRVAALEHP
ncbi:acyltransferase domain-containing protein, partial [Streptomyces sparsus]